MSSNTIIHNLGSPTFECIKITQQAIKTQTSGLSSRVPAVALLRRGLRRYFSIKFPSDANVSGTGTTLGNMDLYSPF